MAASTWHSHSPDMDQANRFLVCLILLFPVVRGLQFLSGGTPLWPCYSVYTVTNITEYRQVGTPDNADCAYTFQSPPGTVMTVTVHDLRVTSTSYYSQPYAGYGVPPPTSNDCNAEAVRIYDYQQDGSLVVASTICSTVNTGDPVTTSRNFGVVTSTVTKGGFYLTVAVADAPENATVSELVPPETNGEGAAETPPPEETMTPASATTEASRGESEASRMDTAATTEQVTREIAPATPQAAPPTLTPSTTASSTTSSSTTPTTTTTNTTSTSTSTSTTPGTTTDTVTATTTLSISATESTTEQTDIKSSTDSGVFLEVPAPALRNTTEITNPTEVITTETPATSNDLKATMI